MGNDCLRVGGFGEYCGAFCGFIIGKLKLGFTLWRGGCVFVWKGETREVRVGV